MFVNVFHFWRYCKGVEEPFARTQCAKTLFKLHADLSPLMIHSAMQIRVIESHTKWK